jgi:hypothetical protein
VQAELLRALVRALDNVANAGIEEEHVRPILDQFCAYHFPGTMELPWSDTDIDPDWQQDQVSDDDTEDRIQKSRAMDIPLEKSVPYSRELEGKLRICKSINVDEAKRWRETGKLPADINLDHPKERYGWDKPMALRAQQILGSHGVSILALQHMAKR